MRAFVYSSLPSRVVFRAGALDDLVAEIERLGAHRALVLSTPEQRASAEDVSKRLGARSAGVYDKAVMHVPIETAEAARAMAKSLNADCCVAIGGGSTIGLGKAIALTSDLPILAIPTTFAGSEMTPIYGITADGQKKTGRDPRVLPKTVIYDPLLTMSLPAKIAGPSGMNAIAHCVEALYAQDANPITSLMAEEGIRTLASSLPIVVSKPDNLDARAEALYGAWLAGACLGTVGTPPATACRYRYLVTLIPIASAAAGDSPTARTLSPALSATGTRRRGRRTPRRRTPATSGRRPPGRRRGRRRGRRLQPARRSAGPGCRRGRSRWRYRTTAQRLRTGSWEGEAGDDLVRAQRDDEEGEEVAPPRHPQAPRDGNSEGEHETGRATDLLHGEEPHHGADEHHSLDAQVEHTRALGEQLTERRVEERRAVGNGRCQHARRRRCCSPRRARGADA